MSRLDSMPGPGDLPGPPEPECELYVAETVLNAGGVISTIQASRPWCTTHDQPWGQCGGVDNEPFDQEPFDD